MPATSTGKIRQHVLRGANQQLFSWQAVSLSAVG
jgi:hypothetical protein